jgi:hypothetical protein
MTNQNYNSKFSSGGMSDFDSFKSNTVGSDFSGFGAKSQNRNQSDIFGNFTGFGTGTAKNPHTNNNNNLTKAGNCNAFADFGFDKVSTEVFKSNLPTATKNANDFWSQNPEPPAQPTQLVTVKNTSGDIWDTFGMPDGNAMVKTTTNKNLNINTTTLTDNKSHSQNSNQNGKQESVEEDLLGMEPDQPRIDL